MIVAVVDWRHSSKRTLHGHTIPMAAWHLKTKLSAAFDTLPEEVRGKSPMITKHEISETEASERLDMGMAQLLAITKK